jgi:class 3 adenylate cyclase
MVWDSMLQWLAGLGLERYAETFANADVDFDILPELTDADLEKLGVTLGHRKRILREIEGRSDARPATSAPPSANDAASGERRHLTVLFCDIVGSTALAARLDPEDLRTVISTYHAACAGVVAAHDGEVAQFLGDGVMVGFGYPRAHEDDAERAVRCALAMIAAVRELVFANGVKLQTRVGIATGTEVVGDLLGASRDRASVVGATPSLASRLQGIAEVETVVIGDATRRLLGDAFSLTSLGSHAVKGFDEPLELWRVDCEVLGASRFAASHKSSTTPFVGRELEIGLLADRWKSATDAEGQAVLLTADAGVGKSRIIEELLAHADVAGAQYVRLQCAQHYTGSALYPIRAALEHAAGIAPTDTTDDRFAKLAAFNALSPKPLADTDALALLLALPGADDLPRVRPLTVEQRKALIFSELSAQLAAFERRQPLLIIVEDLHWIDPTTLELMTQVITGLRRQRVLLIVTARPEFTSPWSHHGNITTLALNRLGYGAVQKMITQLCGGKALPETLVSQILERTDGVPLFVEELTKTILESAAIEEQSDRFTLADTQATVVIPETLRDALTARLDGLANVRDVAQAGAVIGREFSEHLLAAAMGTNIAALQDSLEQLVVSGLVLRNRTVTGAEYSFKHALVRDAAYAGLLRAKRQQLHLQTARAIITQFTATAEAVPELVAQHLEEGGVPEQAFPYWRQAGIGAISRSAYREAIVQFNRALALHAHFPDDGGETELDLRNRIGVVYFVLEGGASANARETYERAWILAKELPETTATFAALWGLCFCDYMSARIQPAREKSAAMIEQAERLGDPDLMLEALHASWAVAFLVGDLQQVLDTTARGVGIYKRERHHAHVTKFGTGHDSGVCGWGHGAMALILAGRIDEGRRWLDELEKLMDVLDHQFSQCIGLIHAANALDLLGQYDSAVGCAIESVNIGKARNFAMPISLGSLICGAAQISGGGSATGVATLKNVFQSTKISAPVSWRPPFMARLALAEHAAGDATGAATLLERAETMARETGGCFAEPEVYRLGAAIARAQNSPWSEVNKQLDRAIGRAQKDGSLLLELRAAADRVDFAPASASQELSEDRDALRLILERVSGSDAADVRRAEALLEDRTHMKNAPR